MPEMNQILETTQAKGEILAETWSSMPASSLRGWESAKDQKIDFLKGIDNPMDRAFLAQMLENSRGYYERLDETTRMVHVGSFEKFVFPIIRALYANLITKDLVTVYPLSAPTGLVFYLDALYGSNKGNVVRGTRMNDARTGPDSAYHYSDEVIEEETAATSAGVANIANNLDYTPIRPGSVEITDGTQVVIDDGNGSLVGNIGVGNNTINYNTGAFDVTFVAAPAAGLQITATYTYNMEANEQLPEVDIQLTSAPVTARTRKLIAKWSIESQQDLQAYHGLNAEVEIVGYMQNQIAKEINYTIIRHLRDIANAGTVSWDRTPPAGVQYLLHKETFYDSLVQLSNTIFSATQRIEGNWIVAGTGVCNVIETMARFNEASAAGTKTAGIRKIGQLGKFTVYKDPTYPASEFLMGYKGNSFLDTGYIWAPYLLLYTTPTIVLEDMIGRKGMMQRTGKKVVNNNFYATGSVIQTGAAF